MKLSGSAVLKADPQRVWTALNDPAVLARCIPGCESLQAVGTDEYKMTVSAGVASIRGTYDGQVRLSDKTEPTSYVMHASGAGGPGTISAICTITLLAASEGTELTYEADAIIGGVVAGVGQRLITGVAKKMAGEFFGKVNDELTGVSKPAPVAAQAAAPGEMGAPARDEPSVFAGRAPAASRPSLDPLSAAIGAVIALVGVLLGGLISRKQR